MGHNLEWNRSKNRKISTNVFQVISRTALPMPLNNNPRRQKKDQKNRKNWIGQKKNRHRTRNKKRISVPSNLSRKWKPEWTASWLEQFYISLHGLCLYMYIACSSWSVAKPHQTVIKTTPRSLVTEMPVEPSADSKQPHVKYGRHRKERSQSLTAKSKLKMNEWKREKHKYWKTFYYNEAGQQKCILWWNSWQKIVVWFWIT